jgi:cysteine desulfurase
MLAKQSLLTFTLVPVSAEGQVSIDDVARAMQPETVLLTFMHSNNEVGSLLSVAELARLAHRHGALMHCDAAQSLGKVAVDVEALGVDLLTIVSGSWGTADCLLADCLLLRSVTMHRLLSLAATAHTLCLQVGHKFGGPKGVAALYVRQGVQLERLLCGGGQESGRRAGTESVVLLAGLGKAAELVTRELPATAAHMVALRDSLQQQLLAGLPPGVARVNGPADDAMRLPNTLSIGIKGISAAALLAELSEQLAASAGAACHSSCDHGVSGVLQAMAVPTEHAVGTLRLSVGRHTTQWDVDRASTLILDYVARQAA